MPLTHSLSPAQGPHRVLASAARAGTAGRAAGTSRSALPPGTELLGPEAELFGAPQAQHRLRPRLPTVNLLDDNLFPRSGHAPTRRGPGSALPGIAVTFKHLRVRPSGARRRMHSAAADIQRLYRGAAARRATAEPLRERHALRVRALQTMAAVVLQRHLRGYLVRSGALHRPQRAPSGATVAEERAAVTLQCAARRLLAARRVTERRVSAQTGEGRERGDCPSPGIGLPLTLSPLSRCTRYGGRWARRRRRSACGSTAGAPGAVLWRRRGGTGRRVAGSEPSTWRRSGARVGRERRCRGCTDGARGRVGRSSAAAGGGGHRGR